jgi:sialate O-acetylesterase
MVLLFLISTSAARGEIFVPNVIGQDMVLQRQMPVPVWGKATAGETVTVSFAGQTKTAVADVEGKWQVRLDPMEASDSPRDLVISGSSHYTFHNVLVGEVWLCSGQSNMEYPMKRVRGMPPPRGGVDLIPTELANANDPDLRLFWVKKVIHVPDVSTTGWKQCTTASLSPFSAPGYFFGKELRQTLKVPVGLIDSTWGGQRIERFTDPQAYSEIDYFHLPSADFKTRLDTALVGDIYHDMIRPMIPYAMRGAIWYQGETNVSAGDDGPRYFHKMQALIDGWRKAWGEGDFPFYYVELAPFRYIGQIQHRIATQPTYHTSVMHPSLPNVWEGQTMALSIPNTGMAATIDITENRDNIHPPDKWDVGHRLALLALAKTYGRTDLAYSGPLYKSMDIQGGKAVIHFDYVGGGLVSSDGQTLKSFTIAGADGQFVPADAEIEGDTVVVSSPQVTAPTAVRFAWTEDAEANLANKDHLPAFPFQTDGPGN